MTSNRREKLAARERAAREGTSYTEALRRNRREAAEAQAESERREDDE